MPSSVPGTTVAWRRTDEAPFAPDPLVARVRHRRGGARPHAGTADPRDAGRSARARRAGAGTQVVILMSGHGVQVPIPESQTDPLDPKNPEPDGKDEVFLPADVKSFTRAGLENAILDNQFDDWLTRLRARGAAVWILFDC